MLCYTSAHLPGSICAVQNFVHYLKRIGALIIAHKNWQVCSSVRLSSTSVWSNDVGKHMPNFWL